MTDRNEGDNASAVPLRPHSLANVKAYSKLLTARDHLTTAPDEPDFGEVKVLIEAAPRWGNSLHHVNASFRGRPLTTKLAVARCQRFGWLVGHGWNDARCLTPLGQIVLVRFLLDQEAAGQLDYTEFRRRHFRSDAESAALLKAMENQHRVERAKASAEQAVCDAYYCELQDHRQRKRSAQDRLEVTARAIGAGRINDIEAAIETLREAEAALQAEESWVNPVTLPSG